jgi:HD superfamily phosphohydrolase
MSSQNNQKWGKTKNIRVPNHDIKIRLHELIFVHTNTFQRLQYIRQLGLAYLVYPFATHTRAAHSFDCLHMAQQFIDHLKYNIGIPEDDEKRTF